MKIHKIIFGLLFLSLLVCTSCKDDLKTSFIEDNVTFSTNQIQAILDKVGEPTGKNYPRTIKDGKLSTTNMYDWTSGFFPGSLWYLYELTGDSTWKSKAEKWTSSLEPLKTFTGHHDLGFMMYCSYGNALRLAPRPEYKDIIIESANSLASRFDERTQVIKSWNHHKSWDGESESFYPVIIDNMMNLEMLLEASKLSGNKRLYDIAVAHANTTLKNHFRDDFGSYHVVHYDTITGAPITKVTAQGYSDNSTWARGQAWAVYGYTMMYRETKDSIYLNTAIKLMDYYLKNLPEDLVPLWDFNVGQEGYTPQGVSYAVEFREKLKDASAAAIVCSALFDLGKLTNDKRYIDIGIKMLESLASPSYRAQLGSNDGFLLMHSVGSIPHHSEIDVPLVYADYYFLEALVRYKRLDTK
ncbi:glycoside hydrolase family 88 protein [Dysgonomonas sp. Marseille-P4677]|uniref:glycoside hydrolase family 88 protein n=1 Tax=Dysgonomonas sp. Marseille-P4677 TaxID=2364790 RepID=UPI0019112B1F|nr:glycoside hydrolase family 88 protein [Dysgonomonas sp. Marseille-P4677]MBK5719335.1 glycoside hydrolase family 88 protein [Dysgonomonas sp. Marseille-P4677]